MLALGPAGGQIRPIHTASWGLPAALPFSTPWLCLWKLFGFPEARGYVGKAEYSERAPQFPSSWLAPRSSPSCSHSLLSHQAPACRSLLQGCRSGVLCFPESPGPQPRGSWCGLPMGCGQLWEGIGQGSLTGWCGWHSALGHLEPLARQTGKFWCRRGRRFQVKLRKRPEPTPSAEWGGREARCVYQDQPRASQSQGPWGGGCSFSGGVSAPTALQGSGRARRLTVLNAETLLSL